MDIILLQNLSHIFIGLTLEGLNNYCLQEDNVDKCIEILEQHFYYILERTDVNFNKKFLSNLNISKRKGDRYYADFLNTFLPENHIDVWDAGWNSDVLHIKRRPKIVAKRKPTPKYNTTPELAAFIVGQGVTIPEEGLPVWRIKKIIHKYIKDNNLQDLHNRTRIAAACSATEYVLFKDFVKNILDGTIMI